MYDIYQNISEVRDSPLGNYSLGNYTKRNQKYCGVKMSKPKKD